jgi:preprotein translocase subunit SecG
MEGLQLFLLVLQIIIAVVLIILVLLQKSDGDSLSGIGGGSGGLNSVVSGKATASILSKITMILIGIFMLNCLILASLSNVKSKAISEDLEKIAKEQNIQQSSDTNSDDKNTDKSGKIQSKGEVQENKIAPSKAPIVPAVE